MGELLLTIPDAMRELQISKGTMQRLLDSGELPSVRIGTRLRRIPRSALEAYIEGLEKA